MEKTLRGRPLRQGPEILHLGGDLKRARIVCLYERHGYNDSRPPSSLRTVRPYAKLLPALLAEDHARTLSPCPRPRAARASVEFIEGVRRLGHHAVVGVRRDRRLKGGTRLDQTAIRGEQVFLEGLAIPVYVASYWLKKRDESRERRFVLCTRALSPAHTVRWGKKRWRIEGFFKTAKGRFSLDRFEQGSRLGVYRYLVLSMIAYLCWRTGGT